MTATSVTIILVPLSLNDSSATKRTPTATRITTMRTTTATKMMTREGFSLVDYNLGNLAI